MTDSTWQTWLADLSQSRCVLVELTHSAGQLYLATMPYQSSPNDTPANMPYDDVVTGLPEISRDESQPVSMGDLEFHTDEAGLLIRHQWEQAVLYLGSPDWPKSDFRLISTSRIERVMRSAVDRVTVEFVGDYCRLIDALPDPALYDEAAGTVIPFIVGRPFHAQPLNTFPALLEYAVGGYNGQDAAINVLSVRDNGVPVAFTPALNGRFRLNSPPVGEVTAHYDAGNSALLPLLIDLTGGNPDHLVTGKGFDDALASVRVGAVVAEGTTYRELIDSLVRGLEVSVQYVPDGSLEIIHYRLDGEADYVVVEDDMVAGSITHTDTLDAASLITVKYAQNFAILSSIAGAAESDVDAVALQSEYQSYSLANDNPVPKNELVIETALADLQGAKLIADRLMVMREFTRYAYRFELFAGGIELRDGDLLDLQHGAWNLSGQALVTSVEYLVGGNRVQVEVLV